MTSPNQMAHFSSCWTSPASTRRGGIIAPGLDDGIRSTYEWFLANLAVIRA
jgi:hypothetical protein